MSLDITSAINTLKQKRNCFVSEADFQLELVYILKDMYPESKVRCEYVPEFNGNMHIDILVIKDNKWYPIELKYKTKHTVIEDEFGKYILKTHGAKDGGCYKFLKDVQRIESVKNNVPQKFEEGYAIMLTNDLSYCKAPSNPDCVYAEFSIHEGAIKTGTLNWAEGTAAGTKGDCVEPIILSGTYSCNWKDYSQLENCKYGKFKLLTMHIQ